MTEKQEKILTTALELFAQNGYSATPTSRVAKEAGVSEGLIFRHFHNKEGLLQAILAMGKERADALYAKAYSEKDPATFLRKVLELPFGLNTSEYPFWRLVYSLKWSEQTYDYSMTEEFRAALTNAFSKLGYEHPEAETELIMVVFDGLATAFLLRDVADRQALLESILAKYDL